MLEYKTDANNEFSKRSNSKQMLHRITEQGQYGAKAIQICEWKQYQNQSYHHPNAQMHIDYKRFCLEETQWSWCKASILIKVHFST